jgi:AbrB family looped-hinge helix DNA binding protein
MGGAAKVTSKGQVTIPASVREDFGIEKGDELLFYKGLDGRMSVRVRRRRPGAGARSIEWDTAPKDRAGLRRAIEGAMDAKHRPATKGARKLRR